MTIRAATADDTVALWSILEPTIRAGETYTLPRGMSESAAVQWWLGGDHEAFVVEDGGRIVGTYYLRPNTQGGGSHVANCGYMTAAHAAGRGVARRMGEHSIARARERGFRAMQFNFVVSTNDAAVHLWLSLGFETVGRLPGAFHHPTLGDVDAFVMYRKL
jgi:ribosomal protein S18 acetylase RimI-like enzyme